MSEVKMYMFRPTDRDLRIEYPELSKVREFSELNTKELKFVWYYANRTSPYYTATKGDRTKILGCIKNSFGNSLKEKNTGEYNKYVSGNFPQKIRIAIDKMERFNPTARLRAKMAVEKIFDNIESSVDIDEDVKEKMRDDLELRKKYVELSIKVSENIPNIVAQMEESFGIKSFGKYDSGAKAPTVMDALHMEDND